MDCIMCVIRNNNSFCMLQTGRILKFPQYAITINDEVSIDQYLKVDLIEDIAKPMLRNKFSNIVNVNGILCVKSTVLPLSKKRLIAFYLLIDVMETCFLPIDEGDFTWQSFKNLEKYAERNKFSCDDLNIIKTIENRRFGANYSTIEFTDVNKNWTEDEISLALTDAQNKLRLSAKYDEQCFVLLKEVFMSICFPYDSMTEDQFLQFIEIIGIADASSKCFRYFRAFDHSKTGRLSFLDFVLGCCALEVHTVHGSEPGEQRCRYIFRFYAQKYDFNMSFGEYVTMIDDIVGLKLNGEPKSVVDAERCSLSKHYLDNFTLNVFLQKVGSLQLRGTSCLFRSPVCIIQRLKELYGNSVIPVPLDIEGEKLCQMPTDNGKANLEEKEYEKMEHAETKVSRAEKDPKTYVISKHVLQVTPSGAVVELVSNIPDGISSSLAKNAASDFSNGESSGEPEGLFEGYAKEILRALDYFRKPYVVEDRKKRPFHWDGVSMSSVGNCILKLCSAALNFFKAERRCLDLDDPIYILGDIHGNISSLFQCEQHLWPLSVQFCPAKILFLGDYVDRGRFGIEVVTYLFAHKVLQPDRIFLLRGNHEIFTIQKHFDFFNECRQKFGEFLGESVFAAVNVCFDAMPLSAIVNKKVFCVHGGIPSPDCYALYDNIVDAINDIPVPLSISLETDNYLAWQLMWNDPCWDEKEAELNPDGFGFNSARETALIFSSQALNNFLVRHGLSHVIRAHEVQPQGFQIRYGSKLVTIFTSSSYDGMDNNAACLLLERGNMRMIQMGKNVKKTEFSEKCYF